MLKKTIILLLISLPILTTGQQAINIIPRPVSINLKTGKFILDKQTVIGFNADNMELASAAEILSDYIKSVCGYSLPLNKPGSTRIELQVSKIPSVGPEGYLLNVTPTVVTINANTNTGIAYGMQTVFQALEAVDASTFSIPAMEITDYPRFKYRGMHLDVGRHFFPVSFVKKYIDFLATYKMNYFHWHLTEDQGWRIEIKKYPRLMTHAAYRNGTVAGRYPGTHNNNLRYGGFYSQEEVKDIVAYAAQRHITVVPEIELPGHSSAAIAAYPWLSCFPEKPTTIPAHPSAESKRQQQQGAIKLVQETWGVFEDIYCAGKDSTFLFLENVMDEVLSLFPSTYIHVGGDEAPKGHWEKCNACQARIQKEQLKDEHELQSYFIQRMEQYLNKRGRILIGWDEILEGGLAPNAVVMSWRGEAGGIEAARLKHDVIMTPGNPVYFDHYQGDPLTEPVAIGGFNTLKRVYEYDPIPSQLNTEQAKHVLGAQANIWTEYIPTTQHVEYMALPRLLALSEVVWSPKEGKDWSNFNQRLQKHFTFFEKKGWNYSRGNYKVAIMPKSENGRLSVHLQTELYNGQVYYTLDGSMPGLESYRYSGPVTIDSSSVLKAITVLNGQIISAQPAQQHFVMHKAIGQPVTYAHPFSTYYKAGGPNALTDGVRGNAAAGSYWHGFSGKDLVADIDLGETKLISSVTLGCLQHYADWIMFPQWVKVETSLDGKKFTVQKIIRNELSQQETAAIIQDFTATFPALKARHIRVTAKVLDVLPKGHPGEGKHAWIFADEIMVH